MFNGSNCDRKSQLSGILTEQLNPRGLQFHCLLITFSITRRLLQYINDEFSF